VPGGGKIPVAGISDVPYGGRAGIFVTALKGIRGTRGRQLSDVVGTADHYGAFVRLCKIRIEQLQITYETVDALAGFPQRYTSTLMSGGRAMSAYSMFTVARVLALTPQFAHDERQHELLQAREDWIKTRRKGPRWRSRRRCK
jgi:hypothetical protein